MLKRKKNKKLLSYLRIKTNKKVNNFLPKLLMMVNFLFCFECCESTCMFIKGSFSGVKSDDELSDVF